MVIRNDDMFSYALFGRRGLDDRHKASALHGRSDF